VKTHINNKVLILFSSVPAVNQPVYCSLQVSSTYNPRQRISSYRVVVSKHQYCTRVVGGTTASADLPDRLPHTADPSNTHANQL